MFVALVSHISVAGLVCSGRCLLPGVFLSPMVGGTVLEFLCVFFVFFVVGGQSPVLWLWSERPAISVFAGVSLAGNLIAGNFSGDRNVSGGASAGFFRRFLSPFFLTFFVTLFRALYLDYPQ